MKVYGVLGWGVGNYFGAEIVRGVGGEVVSDVGGVVDIDVVSGIYIYVDGGVRSGYGEEF